MENNQYFKCLEGITANFLGDSLFAAHTLGKEYSWINLLGEKYKMNYNNYGISGSTLCACEGGANPMIRRYNEMADNDPDIVIFEGGRNDFNKLAAFGSIDEPDETTYLGAIAMLVSALREKYPNAIIAAVTFWTTGTVNSEGVASNTYVSEMVKACEALGVEVIHAYREEESGVLMTNREFRTEYSIVPGDVCHLNAEGMKFVMPYFEREIAKLIEARKK